MKHSTETLATYQQHIAQQVQQQLQKHIASASNAAPLLKDAMAYSLLSGGKRLRPFLVHATGDMLNIEQAQLSPLAAALECIHSYSLIHDDLPAMDNDDLRRGQPTCHIAFDEATAILAGDALQTLAFEILADAPIAPEKRIQLIKLLASAAGIAGMCGGQAIDLAATGRHLNQQQLETMHRMKTGALLKVAVSMVCTLADDLSDANRHQLHLFADNMGLAFQVQDDILDVVGDSKTLGKPQGSDQASAKSTFVALMGIEAAREYLNHLHTQALHALRTLPYNSHLLQAFADYVVSRNH